MVWVAGFDPAASRVRDGCSTRLSYTQVKWRPVRGSNPSHRIDSPAASPDASQANKLGASGRIRTGTVRPLKPFPLPVGVRTRGGPGGTRTHEALRIGLRDRSLCRSGHWSGGLAWLRSTCRRVKSPLPLHSGLRLRVRRLVQAGGVEPPTTRLSAGALAVRTGLRN
jgi:hypothetical protein